MAANIKLGGHLAHVTRAQVIGESGDMNGQDLVNNKYTIFYTLQMISGNKKNLLGSLHSEKHKTGQS